MAENTSKPRAQRWDASEAAKIVRDYFIDGNETLRDKAVEITRRYPLFAGFSITKPERVLFALPNYESARKLETSLRGESVEAEDSEGEEQPQPAAQPVKASKPAKPTRNFQEEQVDEDALEALLQ